MRLLFALILISSLAYGQDCNVCPAGSLTTLQSSFPSSAAHQWTCTNGFNSNLVNPVFYPMDSCICYLSVDDGLCIAKDTVKVNVCNCNNSPCVGLAYNDALPSLTFTKTGTLNSPIATDIVQYKREQQTTWTTVPISNQLTGCDVKSTLVVTPTCDYWSGTFNLGYSATICPGVVMTGWQWRGNDGSAITGSSSSLNDWVSRTPAELTSSGNGGVLDIFARVLSNPNRLITAKIRYSYTGSGTTCGSITSTIISQGYYNFDFEARRIVTYTNGCPPDTCNTFINLPTDNSCQAFGYLARVNFFSGCTQLPGGNGIFLYTVNAKAPVTYQWKYNGTNTAFNPISYTAGGYCFDGRPFGEYCVTATDADGCIMQDCYQYQAICATTVNISISGTTLTATPTSCTGTPTYTWRRFQNGSWTNVGTGTTYNTNGVSGQYQVTLTCTGPPSCTAISEYEYINPCNVGVSISVGTTTLTSNVTGCLGSAITYIWQYWTGSTWSTVQTNSTTSTTNLHSPSVSGLYRILVSCNGCTAQNQASITLPDPCQNFSATITGNTNICSNSFSTFNRTISGGTAAYTTQWFLNFNLVSNNSTYTANLSPGSYTLQVRVIDANNCQYTATRTISVQSCCNLSTSISPSNTTICTNTSQSFTRSASGGSGVLNTVWVTNLNGGANVFEGGGSSITLNKSIAGTYQITATTTDQNGCQSQAFSTLNVNNCTVCNCTPVISIIGSCGLNIAVSGTGCSGYSYQLQYSPSGSGWTTISSGASFNPFNHTPTQNGIYRIVITKPDCGGATAQVSVNCIVSSCTNQPTLSLNGSSTTQCGLTPVVVTSNTFGGSATNVTLSENGAGSLTTSSFGSSPFSFTYTPSAGDVNNTVTITATTNNPLLAPCSPASATYQINILSNPTPSITSSNSNLCVGQSRTLVGSPVGGTFSVISGSASIVGNTLTVNGTGSITVQYSLNVGGCSGSANQTITGVAIPSAPTTSVNCSGGFNNAVITVTAPTGAGIEYRLNNGAWQSSNIFSGIQNGNQTIFVRNSNGCENSVNVSVNCGCTNNPSIVLPLNDIKCGSGSHVINGSFSGATNVSVTLGANASGTLSSNSLTTSPFSITYNAVAADIGKTIVLTFTSNNPLGSPCVADVKTYSLQVRPLPTGSISGPNSFCAGASAVLTAIGGTGYEWSNGLGIGSVKSITSAGTYTVTVTGSNGCTSTATKSVTQNSIPSVSITSNGSPLCIGQSRTLVGSPLGGIFLVSGVGSLNGNVLSSSTSGTSNITYEYTDGNGCIGIANQSFEISSNPSTPIVNVNCSSGFGNGVITITSPTGAGLEYRLNTGSWQTSSSFLSVANGNYTVSVRNASGCEASATTTVNCGCVNAPTVTLTSNSGTTCGTNPITVSGNTFGGSATQVSATENGGGSLSISTFNSSPFSFTYTPLSGDIGNTVTITFTTNNPNGSPCQATTATYTLQVLPNPTASISGPISVCFGGSVSWTASGGSTYAWSNGLGSGDTKTISTSGTYTVTVTGSNNCTSIATRSLTINALPIPSITSSNGALCVGQTRTLIGSPIGGAWSISGQGQITGNTLTANTSGTANITYSYTDGNGCVNTANQSITLVANPIVPTASVNCSGGFGNGVISVTAPTGAGLEYKLNSGSWQSSNTFSSVANGSYTLSVRNSSGCENSTTINVNCGCANSPTLTLSASGGTTCGTNPITVSGNTFGGSATNVSLSENGAGSLNISSASSSPFSFTYTPAIGDIGNTVTITVTTNNPLGSPCQAVSQTYILQVLQLPTGSISGNNNICIGQSTTLTVSGGSSYNWSAGLGAGNTKTVNPTITTTYTVTVTGANNCTNTTTRTVTVNPLPTPSITSSNSAMCINQTRALVGSPSGGSWSIVSGPGSITGSTLTTNGAGSITIQYSFTDGNGCSATASQSINVVSNPSSPTLSFNCTATSLSTITVNSPTGAGIEYQLNVGAWQTATTFTNVSNGTHTINVRNSTGCTSSGTINTSCGCFSQPTVSISPSSGSVCGLTPQIINGTRGGSATSVSFTHNGGAAAISSTTNASWSITYTPVSSDLGKIITINATTNNPDGSPCNAVSSTYQLTVNALPVGVITGPISVCFGGSVSWTASGGSTYAWSNGLGNGATKTLSTAGSYTVTVTASNTCSSTATRSLTVNSLPTPSITSSNSNLCVSATRSLTGSPSAGTFTVISGSANIVGNTLTATGAGTITIQYSYTDGNGCSNTTTQSFTAIAAPLTPTINSTCTGTSLSQVVITPPLSGGPFTYSFNGSTFTSTTTYNNIPNGNQVIVIRNSTGCETTITVNTNCGCIANPDIILTAYSGSVCGNTAFTQSGNTFSGASIVSASENGAGSLSISSFTSSPFTFTYNPAPSDIGNTSQIVFTSNNPDGAPCQVASRVFNLTINAIPIINISGDNDICIGESTTLTASGASTYSWSNGLGSGASKSVSPTTNTTYTITGTASNGCTSQSTINVTVNPLPVVDITTTTEVLCNQTSRLLTANLSGGTFSIVSGPAGTYILNGNVIVPGNTAGNTIIKYDYTSPSGCTNFDQITIPISVVPNLPTVVQGVCSNGNSQITISPTGAGFTYSINGGSTWSGSNVFTIGLGTFSIAVRNADNCVNSTLFTSACSACGCPGLNLSVLSNSCNGRLLGVCDGYSIQFQRFDGGIWTNVSGSNDIILTEYGKQYRGLISKPGCPDVISNTITNNFTIAPTTTSINFTNSTNHQSSSSWGILGTRFFNSSITGLPITPLTNPTSTSLASDNVWHYAFNSTVRPNRMNVSGVKTISGSNVIQFTIPNGLTIDAIGFGADDIGRLCINGNEIFNLNQTAPDTKNNFQRWYVYNYIVNAGDVIRIEYADVSGVIDGFGVEFYDDVVENLRTQTTVTPVYTTRNVTNATYFLCPNGSAPVNPAFNCISTPVCRCY